MQIAFFLTPIIWKPEQLGAAARLLPFNPFFSLLEIVRAPLLGSVAPAGVWAGALAYSVVAAAASPGCSSRACAAASRSGCERMAGHRRRRHLASTSRSITATRAA